jgi:hypothetical protein
MSAWQQESRESEIKKVIILRYKEYFDYFIYNLVIRS